jgi:hypothetical protein
MPQKKFRMFLSSKNTQTTAYHRFHAERQTNPNFQMNAGCCGNRNPLKGWRKEQTCCLNCCTRTQRVDGRWSQLAGVGTPGQVFTQDQNGTIVTGTLIEWLQGGGDDYGFFQMADCHSAFSAGNDILAPTNFLLRLNQSSPPSPPIDTNVPCQSGGKGTSNSLGYQMVFKNVQNCCKPSRLKMVQNRAASSPEQTAANGGKPYSVSGKIDKNYNYNYRQYLKKRCMIADYDNTGGRQRSARVTSSSQHVLEAPCCTTTCCKCVRTQKVSGGNNGLLPPSAIAGWVGLPIIGAEYSQLQGGVNVYGVLIAAAVSSTFDVVDTATFQMLDCQSSFRAGPPSIVNVLGAASSFRITGSADTPQDAYCPEPHKTPSDILTYKRNNWGFRKQGAVDSSLYIATKKVFANPCCAGKLETDRDTNRPVTPEPPNPPAEEQIATKKEEVEVPRPPVLAKEAGGLVKNGGSKDLVKR